MLDLHLFLALLRELGRLPTGLDVVVALGDAGIWGVRAILAAVPGADNFRATHRWEAKLSRSHLCTVATPLRTVFRHSLQRFRTGDTGSIFAAFAGYQAPVTWL